MENYVSRQEHDEFARRIDEENHRQNRRIEELEKTVRQIGALTISVEKMAVSMENMLVEQKKQGERLEKLEKEPAETHKQIKMSIVTALIGTVIGVIVTAVLTLL